MSNLQHQNIPFSFLHKARFASGLFSARPLSAEGVGDVYYSTDTGALSIGLADTSWADFTPGTGGLAYLGTRLYVNPDVLIPGDDSSTYFQWDNQSWEYGGDFGGFPGSGVDQPETGFYEFHLNLVLENTAPARWHMEAYYDGGDGNVFTMDFNTDGTGNNVILSLSDQFLANKDSDTGGYFYLYLFQNGGVDLNVRAYSSMTFRRIAEHP